jgi:hypothetical protein
MSASGFLRLSYVNGRWRADTINCWRVVNQLRDEAGVRNDPWPDGPEVYGKLLAAASAHGLGLETDDVAHASCESLHRSRQNGSNRSESERIGSNGQDLD